MLNDLSTLTNEVWSMIAEFPDYQVSNHGRVKHIYRNGREYILRPWLDRYGYPTVHIHGTTQRVHRLVAQAFILRYTTETAIAQITVWKISVGAADASICVNIT